VKLLPRSRPRNEVVEEEDEPAWVIAFSILVLSVDAATTRCINGESDTADDENPLSSGSLANCGKL
jgi:hypothetical protein